MIRAYTARVFRDFRDRELLHQPSHPTGGGLQPAAPEIPPQTHVGEDLVAPPVREKNHRPAP